MNTLYRGLVAFLLLQSVAQAALYERVEDLPSFDFDYVVVGVRLCLSYTSRFVDSEHREELPVTSWRTACPLFRMLVYSFLSQDLGTLHFL
jgi:hypothetical protein